MNCPIWLLLIIAYLLGSIPSAIIVSRLFIGKDIRDLGDGNMGAKNTFHQVGWSAGVLVAIVDITKGALAVWIAQRSGIAEVGKMITGIFVVLGHDYPLFAHFRGGQGMATIVGVLGMFFPQEILTALVILGIVLVLSRNWDLSCALAFISLVSMIWIRGQTILHVIYPIFLLPTIGLRKILQRRERGEAFV